MVTEHFSFQQQFRMAAMSVLMMVENGESETRSGSTQVARCDSTCSEVARADKQNNVIPETYFSL